MITLGGYLLFAPATVNTGTRLVIDDLDAEVEADLVGVLEADLVATIEPDVECG